MSVMSMLDLQCQEVQERLELLADGDPLPEPAAVELTIQWTYQLTPVNSWEVTLPYMVQWLYDNIELRPAARH